VTPFKIKHFNFIFLQIYCQNSLEPRVTCSGLKIYGLLIQCLKKYIRNHDEHSTINEVPNKKTDGHSTINIAKIDK